MRRFNHGARPLFRYLRLCGGSRARNKDPGEIARALRRCGRCYRTGNRRLRDRRRTLTLLPCLEHLRKLAWPRTGWWRNRVCMCRRRPIGAGCSRPRCGCRKWVGFGSARLRWLLRRRRRRAKRTQKHPSGAQRIGLVERIRVEIILGHMSIVLLPVAALFIAKLTRPSIPA